MEPSDLLDGLPCDPTDPDNRYLLVLSVVVGMVVHHLGNDELLAALAAETSAWAKAKGVANWDGMDA